MPVARPLAVLDTSFWIAAYRAEVAANCLDLFEIVVPQAVEAEIFAIQVDAPRREYPYATLFRHLRGQMLDHPPDADQPLDRFGRGEAEAISVARHLDALLLINERPGGDYAAGLGILVVTVPTVIVALRSRDIISDRAARRKLELIGSITAREYLVEATVLLDRLATLDEQDAGAT
jgi:predicted nucleic acid-binding protein